MSEGVTVSSKGLMGLENPLPRWLFAKGFISLLCGPFLMTWQLVSPRANDSRENKKKATVSFMIQSQKRQLITSPTFQSLKSRLGTAHTQGKRNQTMHFEERVSSNLWTFFETDTIPPNQRVLGIFLQKSHVLELMNRKK